MCGPWTIWRGHQVSPIDKAFFQLFSSCRVQETWWQKVSGSIVYIRQRTSTTFKLLTLSIQQVGILCSGTGQSPDEQGDGKILAPSTRLPRNFWHFDERSPLKVRYVKLIRNVPSAMARALAGKCTWVVRRCSSFFVNEKENTDCKKGVSLLVVDMWILLAISGTAATPCAASKSPGFGESATKIAEHREREVSEIVFPSFPAES